VKPAALLERVYDSLPAFAQDCALSFRGFRHRHDRFGGSFLQILEQYVSRERATEPEILAVRASKLRRILTHAKENSVYWQRCFASAGFDPEHVTGPDDLRTLPIMTKDDVLRHKAQIDCAHAVRDRVVTVKTSGTTGTGLMLRTTREALRDQWAVWWRFRVRHGLSLSTWHAVFLGFPIVPGKRTNTRPWRTNWAERQVFFSQSHLRRSTAPAYAAALEARALDWYHGYPSTISYLASTLLELGIAAPQPRTISLGAESVLEMQRVAIEKAFGVAPIAHYGLTEGVANASQCSFGRYHVDEDFAAVELLPANDGLVRIIGTSLSNFAMPLVRYDTGDLARPFEGNCGCGIPGRVLDSIDGRREDMVELADGSAVGRLDHLFKNAENVIESQIRQRTAGSVRILVVPRSGFGHADVERILGDCNRRFGDRLSVAIETVPSIPRTPRGKFRFVIREEA
jgi:phenylacetate-coenzyme A ligase PaaK-like adenylate-forming protein